ncbi:SHOCT domain-containing protein [Rhizobium sp.]
MPPASLRLYHLAALPLVLFAAGCSSTSTSGDVLANDRPRPAPVDKYPGFSKPLESAMAQMTDEEAVRQERQLSALARQRQSGGISEAEYRRRVAELRRLGDETQ